METPTEFITKFGHYHALMLAKERERVKRFIPEDLQDRSFIAGGFVASPWKANDVDIWVSVRPRDNPPSEDLYMFGETLHNVPKHIDYLLNYTPGARFEPSNGIIDDEYRLRGFFVAGTIYEDGQKPVQVILTDIQNGDDLLRSFDLACHAVGVGLGDNEVYVHPEWKHPIQGPTKILDLDTPLHTLKRYLKLAERYMWPLRVQDVQPLLDLVMDKPGPHLLANQWTTNNLADNIPSSLGGGTSSRAA